MVTIGIVAGELEGRKPRVLVPGRSSTTPRYQFHNICKNNLI